MTECKADPYKTFNWFIFVGFPHTLLKKLSLNLFPFPFISASEKEMTIQFHLLLALLIIC